MDRNLNGQSPGLARVKTAFSIATATRCQHHLAERTKPDFARPSFAVFAALVIWLAIKKPPTSPLMTRLLVAASCCRCFCATRNFKVRPKTALFLPMQPAKPNRPFVTGLTSGYRPMPDVQHFCCTPRLNAQMTANAAKKKKKLRGNRQQGVCAFRANWLIVRQAIMKQPNYFWSRVILLVDRQNRHATEKFRRCYPFAVKS